VSAQVDGIHAYCIQLMAAHQRAAHEDARRLQKAEIIWAKW
jgi:hypothetical protein